MNGKIVKNNININHSAQPSDWVNYQLDFETSINKDKSNKKAFTPDEKYQKMLEKNPLLAQFRERLDLDVGY